MTSLFVTATGTGVGKTFVASRLAAVLKRAGSSVGVFKPFSCGSWGDTRALIRAIGGGLDPRRVTPVYLSRPLAPVVKFGFGTGGARAGRRSLARVLLAHRFLISRYSNLVIEGAGGVLVPLWKDFFVADLAKRLGSPAWVVARPGLGTLNHTLLTVEALRGRGIDVRRVLLSGFTGASEAERTNPRILARLTGLPVTRVPRLKNSSERVIEGLLLRVWREDFGLKP